MRCVCLSLAHGGRAGKESPMSRHEKELRRRRRREKRLGRAGQPWAGPLPPDLRKLPPALRDLAPDVEAIQLLSYEITPEPLEVPTLGVRRIGEVLGADDR